jgi:hypothetical protein
MNKKKQMWLKIYIKIVKISNWPKNTYFICTFFIYQVICFIKYQLGLLCSHQKYALVRSIEQCWNVGMGGFRFHIGQVLQWWSYSEIINRDKWTLCSFI